MKEIGALREGLFPHNGKGKQVAGRGYMLGGIAIRWMGLLGSRYFWQQEQQIQ